MKAKGSLSLLFLYLVCISSLHAQIITTVAGTGASGFGGDNGPATAAIFNSPHDVVVQGGNVYFSDQNNNRVRKISPLGIITTIAGNGTPGFFGDGSQATEAELNLPSGLAIDNSGNLYIADQSNYRIRKINTSGIITTIAGNGVFTYTGDDIPATAAGLFPSGVAVDGSGNVYIAEQANYRIRKVNSSGIISTIAGTGVGGFSGDGFPATNAQIGPIGVCVDNTGNVYIADVYNNRIRIVNSFGIINTFAGNGSASYGGDGTPATAASLQAPQCVRADSIGNVYIADNFNSCIRKVNTLGIISTMAGIDTSAFRGDNGPATMAELNGPSGVVVDESGKVYIADNLNNRIRKVAPPDLQPITGTFILCPGATVALGNSTFGGSWSTSNSLIATAGSGSGIVTGVTPGTATVTYSIYDSTVEAVVTILPWSECPNRVNMNNGIDNNTFLIYPNPNRGSFNLSAGLPNTTNLKDVKVEVFDLLGRTIYQGSAIIENGSINETITLGDNIATAVYFLKVVSNGESKVLRFTLER